jgi:hypothetical protein
VSRGDEEGWEMHYGEEFAGWLCRGNF